MILMVIITISVALIAYIAGQRSALPLIEREVRFFLDKELTNNSGLFYRRLKELEDYLGVEHFGEYKQGYRERSKI